MKKIISLLLILLPIVVVSQKTTIKVKKEEDTFLKGIWVDLVKSKCNCTLFYSTTNRIIIRDSLNNDVTEFFNVEISLPHYVRDYNNPKDAQWNEVELAKHIVLVDKSPPKIVVKSKLTKGSIVPDVKTENYPIHKVQINIRNDSELSFEEVKALDSVYINSGDAAINSVVTSFNLQIGSKVFESNDNIITNDMKETIKGLDSKDVIIFRKVKYDTFSKDFNSSFEIGIVSFIVR